MVKGKMMPSSRLCKPRSNETVFVVFPVSWPGMGFFGKQIYIPEAENDLDTTCWHEGAKKTVKMGASRRPEVYTGGLGNIIPWYCWGHEGRRA
jgi:hypothetical protein